MLELDIQQIISQALSFLILLWVLRRFAWKPLLQMLDSRQRHIEENLRKAAEAREDVVRLQEDYGARLAQIDQEARVKIQQAILEGKRIASEVQEQARSQGKAILAKSKETAELEVAKAKVALRDQVADMTLEAVERILRQKVDTKTDRQLVDALLDELEKEQKGS